MNLFGGIFFFGEVIFFLSASSLRSLWGLFWGSSCGSTATAKTLKFLEILGVLRWIWMGIGEKENEKEMSDNFGR